MYADTATSDVNSVMAESDWARCSYQRRDLERDLRRALARREMEVHYQPKVSLLSGMMRGVEVLLRWRHPLLGLIAPALFLPLAEDSGLILDIGEWLLNEVCHQAASWLEPGIDTTIAINVSQQQVQRGLLMQRLLSMTESAGIPLRAIELEVDDFWQHGPRGIGLLKSLRIAGVRIAVDHVGSKHPDLAAMRNMEVDVLKIDRSIVRHIECDAAMRQRVLDIVSVARDAEMETVAEGIERETQALCLKGLGCQVGQGYFFARPGPIHRLEYWMEGRV